MSNRTPWLAALLLACSHEPAPVADDPPALARIEGEAIVDRVAHGLFFDADGKEMVPDETTIRATQDGLTAALENGDGERWKQTRDLIFGLVDDDVVAHALYLDVLLADLDAEHEGRVAAVTNGLRWHYLLEIRQETAPAVGERWTRGVSDDVVSRLESAGVPVALVVGSGGEDYRKACEAAGVPVPDRMFGPGWVDRGEVVDEFLDTGETILLTWETAEPDGICLALPRYSSPSDDTANLFGVICLGRQSSNACFWDNPRGNNFLRDVEIPFSQFVGGVDLVPNGQGECTDCHAGENPFVVHPEKKPFADVLAETSLMPLSWHKPLVDASWIQNPGPTNVLDAVSSEGRCDSCHRAGVAGRFPALSQEFSKGYCPTVLDNAVRDLPPGDEGTMPAFGGDQSLFTAHIEALQDLCDLPDHSGEVVDTDVADDPAVVSPPKVIDPIYACTEVVGVTGSVLHADVTVFVNGSAISTHEAFSPSMETFSVPALVVGDVVETEQVVDGVSSARSPAVTVRDHKVDYPAGLPTPKIAPPIVYECASTIAVEHVPGARFTVYTNGADPRVNWGAPGGYTVGHPAGAPFSVGDVFTAEVELCDDRSPLSDPVDAKASPSTLPAPTFVPPQLYVGQELVTLSTLVHGADTTVFESGTGDIGRTGSWPVTWYPDFYLPAGLGRPLALGDVLFAQQTLCYPSPPNGTGEVEDCTQLPPPLIATPWAGQTWVSVTDSVPGARIRVYDAASNELGDGSGTVVLLNRALTGSDVLTVTQSLEGKCNSGQGYQVEVQGRDR